MLVTLLGSHIHHICCNMRCYNTLEISNKVVMSLAKLRKSQIRLGHRFGRDEVQGAAPTRSTRRWECKPGLCAGTGVVGSVGDRSRSRLPGRVGRLGPALLCMTVKLWPTQNQQSLCSSARLTTTDHSRAAAAPMVHTGTAGPPQPPQLIHGIAVTQGSRHSGTVWHRLPLLFRL